MDLLPLPYSHFWTAVWSCGLLTAGVYALASPSPSRLPSDAGRGAMVRRALGFGVLSVPVWIAIWGFVNSIPALQDPGSFLPPRSTTRLSSNYIRSLLMDIGYLGVGYVLWAGTPSSLRGLGQRLTTHGIPIAPGSEARSMLLGTVWFPALLAGTAGLDWLVSSQVPALINGDESRVWEHMTPFHAVMLSAAAAVTEELVYRLLLMGAVHSACRRLAWDQAAWPAAIAVQSLVFAAAHGGYGTLYHVLGPFLFGLIAGITTWRWGLWAAIMLHFWIDLFVFGVHASQGWPWMLPLLWSLLTAMSVVGVGWAWLWTWSHRTSLARQQP